jgi:hypothetical protein
MATQAFDPSIPQNGYTAFDATGLRSLIIQRLNQSGVFTDQNYTGSNISSIIDIVAYSYHVLLFYLNQTSSESLYTQANLYENINKIVKILNYNPTGYQTSTLSFLAQASDAMVPGTYTIPRYSYFILNGVTYSFNQDITFTKTTSANQLLGDIYNNNLLYQGVYGEYPLYTATGEPFEQLSIALSDNNGKPQTIDHFNIDVYVKDNTISNPVYEKYTSTESLFLEEGNSKKYEIRLNEKGRYEVKFGDNIHGKQLNANDNVAIYYLQSDGLNGQVSEHALDGNSLLFYNSTQFTTIAANVIPTGLNLVTADVASNIYFYNTNPSTQFQDIESVDSIRTNALNTFKTQYRLVTTEDFRTFISKRYGNILASTQCVSNQDYINGHLKYFFDIGVEKPNVESRVLLNQVKFSSSCNFNNLYAYCVPRITSVTTLNTRLNYLSQAQKQLISNDAAPYKIATSELVFNDPVYVVVDFGVKNIGEIPTTTIADETVFEVVVDPNQKRNFGTIQQSVASVFQNYFDVTMDNLGKLINMGYLTSQILLIEGITDFRTKRNSNGVTTTLPGISFIIYNPVYPLADINLFQQNLQLPYFKFPILNNLANIVNKINIVTS